MTNRVKFLSIKICVTTTIIIIITMWQWCEMRNYLKREPALENRLQIVGCFWILIWDPHVPH